MSNLLPDNLFDLPKEEPSPPVVLLRELAEEFTRKSRGRVRGQVFSYSSDGASTIRHTFSLVIPAVNDYNVSLFYLWHNLNPYPAYLLRVGESVAESDKHPLRDDKALRRELERTLSNEAINNLIKQAIAMGNAFPAQPYS